MIKRGGWTHWLTDDDTNVVGWLPWDSEEHESHLIEFASDRDAIIARDVLTALEAKPRHE